MRRCSIALAAATLAAAAALASVAPTPAAAKSCAMFRGSGIGITEGIARWMASKAVTDSAKKWAGDAKLTLAPVKLTCSGFSCSGAARGCK